MEKNKFYKSENQFPQAGIVTSQISKASTKLWTKKYSFPLDRKPVFASRNEELVKKYIDTWRRNYLR